jgi:PAS domain S-box-containing protein
VSNPLPREADAAAKRDKFATLYEVGRLVNSTLDLDRVLELVMDTVIRVTGAERGFLNLLDERTGELAFRVARNFDRATIESSGFQVSRNLLKQVASTGEPVLTADAAGDTQLGQFASVAIYGLRSVLCAPLQARGRTLGVVYVDNRFQKGVFTQEDLDLLVTFANQAALAIDNARLFSGLQTAKLYQDRIFASVASGIITLDANGRIQAFNSAAARISGYPPAQAIGRPYTEILPPNLAAKLLRPMLSVAAGGAGNDTVAMEVTCDLPSRPDCTLNIRLSPLRDGATHALGVVLTLDDLTEQRRLEEARGKAEEAHRRVRQVFGQFLSPTLVDRFVTDPSRLKLPGERQAVTVLFADVRGYTTISERLAPEEVVSLLNRFLTLAAEEIQASGGYLDKFIGDAVMGVYNAPEPQSNHAWRAVGTASRIQDRIAKLAQEVDAELGIDLQVGIGVNTGQAVVGTIGPQQAVNFTVIGDAVNVAQRLQATAQGGEVLISEDTYLEVRDDVEAEPLEPLTVKGRVRPVPTYRLIGVRTGE